MEMKLPTNKTRNSNQIKQSSNSKTETPVYEALLKRRTPSRLLSTKVPKTTIKRMLRAATWAPNHRLTEPWRFFISDSANKVRHELATTVYENLTETLGSRELAEPYRNKILNPPVLVFVYYLNGPDEFVTLENYAATACAIQNFALAGYAEGISIAWDTGKVTRVKQIKTVLGVDPEWNLLAALYVGYAAKTAKSTRKPITEITRWV